TMDLELRTSAACPEHKSSDSAFLAFVSHGILDRVCGTRHRNEKPNTLPYDAIFQILNNHNCSH
ncbi:caspase-5 isoform 4, partial [Lynx pardinus]